MFLIYLIYKGINDKEQNYTIIKQTWKRTSSVYVNMNKYWLPYSRNIQGSVQWNLCWTERRWNLKEEAEEKMEFCDRMVKQIYQKCKYFSFHCEYSDMKFHFSSY